MSEFKNTHQPGVLLRPNFASRSGMEPAIHGQPDGRALEEWLSRLRQLRSSAELDRSILDGVHQDLPQSPRRQPVFLLAMTLSCVVFGAPVHFQVSTTAPGPSLASLPSAEKQVAIAAVPTTADCPAGAARHRRPADYDFFRPHLIYSSSQ